MDIEQEIAQRIDKALDGDCGYGTGEWLASRLMPLVRRAQAEAIREYAHSELSNSFEVHKTLAYADRIEQEAGAWLTPVSGN